MLPQLDGNAAMDELKADGAIKLMIDGQEVRLEEGDLLIETAQVEGYVSQTEGDLTVVLDTNLTPELIEEGFVRELISKIQTMRKEADFEVTDRIRIYVQGNEKIAEIFKKYEDKMKDEVLADEIIFESTNGYVKEWNINGEDAVLTVWVNAQA